MMTATKDDSNNERWRQLQTMMTTTNNDNSNEGWLQSQKMMTTTNYDDNNKQRRRQRTMTTTANDDDNNERRRQQRTMTTTTNNDYKNERWWQQQQWRQQRRMTTRNNYVPFHAISQWMFMVLFVSWLEVPTPLSQLTDMDIIREQTTRYTTNRCISGCMTNRYLLYTSAGASPVWQIGESPVWLDLSDGGSGCNTVWLNAFGV